MEGHLWKRYVATLCTDAYKLDAAATRDVITKIEALVIARVLTDAAVALVLYRAGVALPTADRIAPSIRAAITA